MKTIYVALTISLLAAMMPLAGATDCSKSPAHDQIDIPGDPLHGTYLYASAAHPDRIGLWTESNGIGELQTETCRLGGVPIYPSDSESLVLP